MKVNQKLLQALLAAWLTGSSVLSLPQAQSEAEIREGAARVQRVLAEIQSDHSSGNLAPRIHLLAEQDLNALLLLEARRHPETGVESLSVQLQPENTLTTLLTVDLDKVQVRLHSIFETLFQSLLGGKQVLEVEGVLRTEAGEGTYEVTSASLNGIPVPAVVVETVLQAVGSRLEPPFDPTEGFVLLHGIQRVEILQDQVRIFAGKP